MSSKLAADDYSLPASVRLYPYQHLTTSDDWHGWITMIEFTAKMYGVWEYIDPELPDVPSHQPKKPTKESAREAILLHRLDAYNRAHKAWISKPDGPNKGPEPVLSKTEPTDAEMLAEIDEQFSSYVESLGYWTFMENRYFDIYNLIQDSVEPMYMSVAITKAVHEKTANLQALLRALRDYLAPLRSVLMFNIQEDYRAILERAKVADITPEAWYTEWETIFSKAKVARVSETLPVLNGSLAIRDFLEAVGHRMAPKWARLHLYRLYQDEFLGKEPLTLESYGRRFRDMLHEEALRERRIFTTSKSTEGSRGSKGSHHCPCLGNTDQTHSWAASECRILEYVITGSCEGRLNELPSAKRAKAIKKRLRETRWDELRAEISQKGWQLTAST